MGATKFIPLLMGTVLAFPSVIPAQDITPPEPFISGLWEHKIEITLDFRASFVSDTSDLGITANPLLNEWHKGGLPSVRKDANDEAIWGCGFYNREAVGPVYQSSENSWAITLTYACALP